ncbi:hypothetical protein LL965_16320 [Xanthomonas cassavae CFBP 4642]|uniref:Uncharacterized protein n=1 Tax=Xanthomonas cassavae CFBP 4642 TaxID=1219375 RepID=A0ABS8HHG5_9XANT|nr:hypothetical protein [Xanthomonas cassavae]MCC4621572.1 hypothetical protein [Xanthomonas cassavae CFBP 4642]
MKTSFLFLLAAVTASTGMPASAQTADSARLRAAATGPAIAAGRTRFRLIPDAVVRLADTAAARSTQLVQAAADDVPLARLDRYEVLLSSGSAARATSTLDGPQRSSVAAALEARTGQLVLLGSAVKLFGTTPAIARALAVRTGGTVVYASASDGSAMIRYPSVTAALEYCTQLQGTSGVGSVLPEVIPRAVRTL